MNCSITAENAAKPAQPTKAAFGPPTHVTEQAFCNFILPFAERTPPVKQPADIEFKMSCLARYYIIIR